MARSQFEHRLDFLEQRHRRSNLAIELVTNVMIVSRAACSLPGA